MEELESERGNDLLKKYLPILLIGFLCGVFATSLFEISAVWVVAFGVLLLAVSQLKARKTAILFAVLGIGMIGGYFRTQHALEKINLEFPERFEGVARISEDPVQKAEYQRIVLDPAGGDELHGSRLVTFAGKYPQFKRGELVELRCDLEVPENRSADFDYVRYLAKGDIYRICASPELRLAAGQTPPGLPLFAAASNALERKIANLLPSPESQYLTGLLIGGSDRLDETVAAAFRRTGTTHTVAVSGYNITIIASAISALLICCGLWRRQAFWFAVLGIVFFVVMIGAPSSAVRAAIMGILVLWAAKNGRLAHSGRALLLAAAAMVLWSPLILVHDIGFQLSFLATAGIIYVYGPLAEIFNVQNDFLELKSILLITIAAQLGVLGVLVYNFEAFSPISLLANMIILPAIPFIMLGGFVIVLASIVAPWLAQTLAVAVWAALHLEIRAIELLARISWSNVSIEGIGAAWLACYYAFFTLLAWHLNRRSFERGQKSANLGLPQG